jgi:hypothetical protein
MQVTNLRILEVIILKQDITEKSNTGLQGSIYSTLKKEHKEVKEMFEQILDDKKPSMMIFNQIMDALHPHMSGEEKYFYPAIKADDAKEENAFIVDEAVEEHKWAKTLAAEICKMDENDEMWLRFLPSILGSLLQENKLLLLLNTLEPKHERVHFESFS